MCPWSVLLPKVVLSLENRSELCAHRFRLNFLICRPPHVIQAPGSQDHEHRLPLSHPPWSIRTHCGLAGRQDAVRLRRPGTVGPRASCSESVAIFSHVPSSVLGLRKMMTVLLLGQTASCDLSSFHAWHVILSSTRQATVIAVFFLQCRFVGAEAEGGVVCPL